MASIVHDLTDLPFVNHTGAALAGVTSDMGASEAEIFSQKLHQQRATFDLSATFPLTFMLTVLADLPLHLLWRIRSRFCFSAHQLFKILKKFIGHFFRDPVNQPGPSCASFPPTLACTEASTCLLVQTE